MEKTKKIYIALIIISLLFALLVPALADGQLSFYSIIKDANADEESELVIMGSSVTVYELIQTTLIPFINAVELFVILGIICFSALNYKLPLTLPFVFMGAVSAFIEVLFSFLALCEAQDMDVAETVSLYSEYGYLSVIFLNIAISAGIYLLCFGICAVIARLYTKQGLDAQRKYKDCALFMTLVALIPTFISDIVSTADDLISVGLPENTNEVLYLCEPYLTLAIYAVFGVFTVYGITHLFERIKNN